MVNGSLLIGLNLIKVPSEESPDIAYVVDTVLGKCECIIGKSGAPCKHQFVVWATMKRSCPNFMPFFCKEERMRFAEIAIGDDAHDDPSLFDDLRINADIQVDALQELEILMQSSASETIASENPSYDGLPDGEGQMSAAAESDNLASASKHTKEIALKNLEESYDMLRKLVTSPDADRNCYEGVSKFRNRQGKLSKNQVFSALHKFGSQHYFKKINPAAKTALKRAQKWSIGVQPTSTQRRKDGNGSKKRLLSGGNSGSKI